MPRLREFVLGPWRAVAVLGVTQILAWGTLFYPPVLTMPLIGRDLGRSIAFCMRSAVTLVLCAFVLLALAGGIFATASRCIFTPALTP